jgi:hypothetical protein
LEAKSGTQGSDFFSVLPAADGSIRVQFQGGVFDNANIDVMGASAGVTVAAVTDGVVAGNTSYLFTTLSVPGVHNGPPSDRTNPVFSASLNPEFVEFINTMNVPTNYSLGWSGDITVNAGRGVLLTAAQRRNLETNPYQGNSVLPDGANTSRTHVPESAVRGFAQIGHGGSDSQIDSYLPTAGHSGNISVTAGGALTMLAGDFVRQVETGQNVTVTLFGAGAPTPLTFNNKSSVDSRENYVQIGHGGVASANGQIVSGNITVNTESDVTLRGGRGTTSFALIGHGGRDSTGSTLNRQTAISGNISVDAGGGIDIEAGSRDRAFAMIGHGGVDFEDTNLAPIGPIIFMDDADNSGTQPDIRTLTDTVFRSVLNNQGVFSRNAVGSGVTPLMTDQTFEVATILGNIGVVSRGVHALTGEGLTILGGQKTTAITLNASGDPLGEGTVEGTRVTIRGRFAQIGHGGANIDARIGAPNSGNINVDVLGGSARLKGGIYVGDSARIGHGGRDFTGSTVAVGLEAGSSFVGNVTVNLGTGFDLTLLGGDAPTYDINDSITGVGALTKGSLAYFYNPNQDDFLLAPSDPGIPSLQTALLSGLLISPNDSSIRDLEISLRLARGALSGLTSAAQVRDAILTAMGLTPSAPLASLGSAAAVNAAAVRLMGLAADVRAGRPSQLDGDPALDPTLPPGEFYPTDRLHNQQAAMAQIGHGGSRLGGAGLLQGIEKWDGHISVNTGVGTRGRDVILRGGDGMDNFAMIGHGGHEVRAPITVNGNVVVNAGQDLLLEGGDYFANSEVFSVGVAVPNYGSYAQVGHMFTAANGGPRTESTEGNITATAVRDIVLSAGGGTFAHAMIGSGANFGLVSNSTSNLTPLGGHRGNINVVSGRDLMLTPSEIREDDDINEVAYEGSLLQIARLRGPFQGTFSFAQIGHGGAGVSPVTGLFGDIEVLVGSNLVSGSRSLDKWAGTSRNPNETAQNPNTRYTLGSVSTAATLAADTSRGIGAYSKIGHGDYLVYPTAAGVPAPGVGLRSGDVRVATGQDLWAAGLQIGHIDPATSPGATFEPASSSTFIAVSRNNPTSLGTGRLITDRSVSNYATAPDPLNPGVTDSFFGGRNQSILATSISSGTGGLDRVRIYMPDRRFGRGNGGGAGAATFGSVDSNDMRGRYSAITDGLGNTLVSTFGTLINGGGYDDPENDTAGNLAGNLIGASYNTVRGSTPALSGSADDNLGDEALATEFTFTRTAEGLPQGSFTPEGGFQTHTYGTRYMIYYTDDRVPPVVTPPTPPPAPSPGGGGPIVPVGPVVPFSGSFVTNGDQGVGDRYGRPDEVVAGRSSDTCNTHTFYPC